MTNMQPPLYHSSNCLPISTPLITVDAPFVPLMYQDLPNQQLHRTYSGGKVVICILVQCKTACSAKLSEVIA